MADPYLYPGTTILKNHFDIRDAEKLERRERRLTFQALTVLQRDPVDGQFDFDHLRDIHRRIFEPVYPFAGETRTVNLQKSEEKLGGASVQYAPFHLIRIQAGQHLKELGSTDWSGLKDMSRPQDMALFAQKIIDVWQVHPFREGNTRTTMTFMHQFAEANGMGLDRELLRDNAEFVRHALVVGTFGQSEHLTRILTDARQREFTREQEGKERGLAKEAGALPKSADDMLTELAYKLAGTDDLAKQGEYLDQFIKAAQDVGSEDHLELARKAGLYKEKLERREAPEHERSAPRRSSRGSGDDGYGL
ncbi:toxin-antitoxin system, toxin component, Fic family [Roseibium sp. TrichSKD4]|uniref:Fic/DOC family protein n=1 Tax=Roseibium sp. TrichSKD4 TaxID=744980 RepID=UPI0001E5721D|nr:Fic family protein [Roseibium sp. TrichSKD4]EFO28779.1 toxin-antitoxin system, toxin component, Fic family [Roseibium sp. TrichSKD4]